MSRADDETAGFDRYTRLVVDAIGPRAEVVLVAGSLGGAHTGALQAQEEAARVGGYGSFDVATSFLHDVDPGIAAEGERYQRAAASTHARGTCQGGR